MAAAVAIPLGLIVGATIAVGAATGHLGTYINNISKSGDEYTASVKTTAASLKTNLVSALNQTVVSQADVNNQVIAAGKALGGVDAAVHTSGQSWDVFGKAVTGTDKQFNTYIDTLKEHLKAAGADSATIRFQVADILKRRGVTMQYHVMPGISHYGIYREAFAGATRMEIEWFTKYLLTPTK
jgi:hypothetical protein